MSRWTQTFETHGLHDTWNNIKIRLDDLKPNDETVAKDVQEVARLKKVIVFLDELLEACDPELMPLNHWDQFNQQASQLLGQINNFKQNPNVKHIHNANSHADSLLSYLHPYVLTGKGAAQAAGQAFRAYSKEVNKNIDQVSAKANNTLNEAEEKKQQISEILDEIDETKDRIKELEEELLNGTDDEESLQSRMQQLFDEVTAWHTKIESFHQKLTSGNEDESAIILQIDEAKDKALQNASVAEKAKGNIDNLIQELRDFHTKIFGKPNRQGELEGGLQQELNSRRKEIDEFKQSQQKRYKALLAKIESLLPGATSAGLATAYKDLKDTFEGPIKRNSWLFYGALTGLFIIAFIAVVDNVSSEGIEFINVGSAPQLLNNMLYKLPFFIPLLWLAVYASKRRSEYSRLEQE